MLVVPRVIRLVASFERAETLLVASIGICFAFAILADHFGYSVALGAFLAGSLVAESGQGHKVEHLILPVRDMFAAVFFVSVGMMLNPALVAEHWVAMLILVATVVGGQDFRRHPRRDAGGIRTATLSRGWNEPRADRRVLIHHRGAGAGNACGARLPLFAGSRGFCRHYVHHAISDQGLGSDRGEL